MSLDDWTSNPHRHAMQVRVYAEDPAKNFQLSPGVITSVDISIEAGTRVDKATKVLMPAIPECLRWD